MKTSPPLPRRLHFENAFLPVVPVQKQPQGQLKRVRTKGDAEYVIDPHGRYAYHLVADFSYLYQWRIAADGILHPLHPHQVPAHSHPNTLQFHPNGRFAYVTCSHGAVCQYRVSSGALIPLTPLAVYMDTDPSPVWFDRTGHYACVLTLGLANGYPPNDRLSVFRISNTGHLELVHKIEVRKTDRPISQAAYADNLSAFTVSGNHLIR